MMASPREELAGDFAVGQAAGDLDEDLGLPGQVGKCARRALGRPPGEGPTITPSKLQVKAQLRSKIEYSSGTP
jgi:hypothetical protein